MTRSRIFGLLLACWALLTSAVRAEEPKPTITLVFASQKVFLKNLEGLMSQMAGSPNQYATVQETIANLLLHSDPNRPISYRAYLTGKELRELYTIPVSSPQEFAKYRTTLADLGFTTRLDPTSKRGEELYRFSVSDTGSIRFDPTAKVAQMCLIGNTKTPALQAASRTLVRAISSAAPDTILKGRDIAVVVENAAGNLADRKAAFGTLTANINAAIEARKDGESAAEHALRVAASKQQMGELERFFVEAARIEVGSYTDLTKGTHKLDFEISAIPDTSLAKSVDQMGKTPDEFVGVSREGALVIANANVAVDELRKKNFQDLGKLSLPALNERIDKRADLTPEAKQAEKDLAEITTQVVTDVAELGVFDGFARVIKKGTEHTTIGGVRVPDSKKFLAILEKINGRKGAVVKLDVEKIGAANGGTVSIHTIAVPHAAKEYPEFLGADGLVYVGTGEGTVWYAYGDDALTLLRQAVQATMSTGAKPNPLLVDATVAILPYLSAWDKRQGTKGDASLRKAAIAGLSSGKDQVEVKMWRDEKQPQIIRFQAVVESGILKAIGKVAAKVVHDKLE